MSGLGYIRNISAYLMFVTILLCFGLEIATERQALERYRAFNDSHSLSACFIAFLKSGNVADVS